MGEELRISYLIPLYNCAKYVKRCIKSIACQNLDDSAYEIIVVDDGSTDGGGDIVAEILKTRSNIKLIRQANVGVSCARNVALEVATGKYIYFVDADDLLVVNSIESQLNLMDKYKLDALKVDFYKSCESNYTAKIGGDYGNTNDIVSQIRTGVTYLHETNLLRKVKNVGPYAFVYSRKLLIDNSVRFDKTIKISEDYLFHVKALLVANRIAISSQSTYIYIQYDNSSSHAHRSYEEISDIGLNLYKAFRSICEENEIHFKGLEPVISAYKDYIVFAYILWPMIREAVSVDVCKDMIKLLKKERCYPISKPAHIEGRGINMEYNKTLNLLWHISRYYPLWIIVVGLQRLMQVRTMRTCVR